MFERLKGKLEEVKAEYIVIGTDTFSYKVFTSLRTIQELPVTGSDVMLYLYPVIKEDSISLYGFLRDEDRDIFTDLLSVNKIGPKIALALLSLYNKDEIISAIQSGNVKILTRANGLGKRGAELIITTLKDKYKGYVLNEIESIEGAVERLRERDDTFNEAVDALTGLGYSWDIASEAVRNSYAEGKKLEDVLKDALVSMNE